MTAHKAVFPGNESSPGIYIHVPFCVSRCVYCTFVTARYHPELEGRFVKAVVREIELRGRTYREAVESLSDPPDTLYFGGGTPSLLQPESVATLIAACIRVLHLAPEAEITMEMNPATAVRAALERLRGAGVNRMSLGVQSLNDEELVRMGRAHAAREALDAFDDLRAAGFDNVSVDVIIGFPGQTPESLDRTLNVVLERNPEHLSAYLLELKEGARLSADVDAGKIEMPDDDLAADLYEQLCQCAVGAGLEQYEIANFARPCRRSRHNLKYWKDGIWLGIGPGAHGMTGRVRYVNEESLTRYERCLAEGRLPESDRRNLTPNERFRDALIMGLRLTAGLDLVDLSRRYDVDAYTFVIETVGDLGTAELFLLDRNRLALTARGRLLSNVIFSRWV